MTCHEARTIILAAEPSSLVIPAPPLAGHLEACAECRRLHRRVLAHEHELRTAYGATEPRHPAEQAARRAASTSAVRRLRRRGLALAGTIGLAAAAAVLLMFAGRGRHTTMRYLARSTPQPEDFSSIEVEFPDSTNALVFRTRNPKISVVWIY